MRAVFSDCARRIPTVYVAPQFGPPESGPNVRWIRQSASYFLASTLPRLVRSGGSADEILEKAQQKRVESSVLTALLDAFDHSKPERVRCDAIDLLLRTEFSMSANSIRDLLRDDSSPVRVFALGLILLANDQDQLLADARDVAKTRVDEALSKDIELLESLSE